MIKFLDSENTPIFFTIFEDEYDGDPVEHEIIKDFNNLETYKRKVEEYLRAQSNNITIYKLRNNVPITKSELDELERILFEQGTLGTKEEFVKAYGEHPLGKFVRSIVGLDSNSARMAFGEILNNKTLNSQQIRFMDMIVNFLSVNGVIDTGMLFEQPFTDLNSEGITGVFDEATSTKIISLIEQINQNSEAA